jgi:hypothetical protein
LTRLVRRTCVEIRVSVEKSGGHVVERKGIPAASVGASVKELEWEVIAGRA